MIILTGANSDIAKNEKGEDRDDINFRFSSVINSSARKAKELGYTIDIYDLGALGMGKPFVINDEYFAKHGHYEREVIDGYKSKSLFKPALVRTCLTEHNELTVYLDGDAELRSSIDDIDTDDYDVGVTLRDKTELEGEWYEAHKDIVKFVNAGVIFFNPTPATFNFVKKWESLTDELGNDQMALNSLTCTSNYPEINSIRTINGVRVKYFSCLDYNYYHFDLHPPARAKIMHFKGTVRHLYPYTWRTRLHCTVAVPVKRFIKGILGPK